MSQICLNEEKDTTLGGKKREVKHEKELRSKHGYNQNTVNFKELTYQQPDKQKEK